MKPSGKQMTLTILEEKTYEFIVTYIKKHGYSPSVREIMAGVGCKSTSSVQLILVSLIDKGLIETDAPRGTPRALRVPEYEFVKKN